MFRAKWSTIVAAALSCCGPVLAQQALPAPNVPRVVTIQEEGKPAMQCRVLKTWKSGPSDVFEVESLTTGERITLVESGPLSRHSGGGKVVQEVRSHIYHWVHNTRPSDAPMAPADAIVPGTPKSPVQLAQPTKPIMLPTPPPAPPVAKVTPAFNPQPAPTLATVTPVVRTAEAPPPVPPASVVPAVPVPPATGSAPSAPGSNADAAPAKPSNWRLSWGKASDHKSEEPAPVAVGERPPSHMPPKEDLPQATKTSTDPLADPEGFSPYELKHKEGSFQTLEVKPGEGVNAKKKDEDKSADSAEEASADGSADAKKAEPSSVDKKDTVATEKKDEKKPDSDKTDAAKQAEKKDAKPAEKKPATKDSDKAPAKKPEQGATLGERFKSFFARKEADKPKPEAAPEEDPSTGMRSVYAASEAAGAPKPAPGGMPPPPVITITDADPSNAFTTVVKRSKAKKMPSEQANAFDGTARQAPSMPPYQVPQGTPPVPPPGYAGVPPTPPGVAPIQPSVPPTYGYAPAAPAGVMPVAYANPNMPRPGMAPTRPMMDRGPVATAPAAAPGQANASSSPDTAQLLLVLRSSLFPSNREWAVEQLSHADWHSNPVIVEMLLQSARNDPAPSVRESCVRNLGKMNAKTPSVVEALTALQKDENDGVRSEVTRTLAKFQTAAQPAARSAIQPVSMR
jgi:hypothetical protein